MQAPRNGSLDLCPLPAFLVEWATKTKPLVRSENKWGHHMRGETVAFVNICVPNSQLCQGKHFILDTMCFMFTSM